MSWIEGEAQTPCTRCLGCSKSILHPARCRFPCPTLDSNDYVGILPHFEHLGFTVLGMFFLVLFIFTGGLQETNSFSLPYQE